MGFINENRLIKMIRLNKIINCEITEEDVRRSVNIYGKSIDYLKGNSNARKGSPIKFEPSTVIPREIQRAQMLSMDIMQIGKQLSLVTVCTPLEMTFIVKLKSKSEIDLGNAIINQIRQIENKGFRVETIVWDSEAAVRGESLSARIRSEVHTLETLEPGRHVARVERKIQSIKKMFRSIKTGTVFDWDTHMDTWCIQFCVQRINHMAIENGPSETSPWERMTGKRPDATYDYRHQYAQYVQYIENDTTSSTTDPRTHGALALFPAGSNMWYYRRLSDGKVIRRGRAIEMPISVEIISYINDRAKYNKGPAMPLFALGDALDIDDMRGIENIEENDMAIPLPNQEVFQPNEHNDAGYHEDIAIDMNMDKGENNGDIYDQGIQFNDEEEAIPLNSGLESAVNGGEQNGNDNNNTEMWSRVNSVVKQGGYSWVRKCKRPKMKYIQANMTVKEAVADQGDIAIKEIIREMTSIHLERRGFTPVHEKDLTMKRANRIITSKMFLKNKYNASGQFEKIKARLVAGGHLQDRDIYSNGGSPTAATTSVLTIAALAATEGRAVGTIDFPSAFLNCDMPEDSEEVLMRLDPFVTMVMTEIDKDFIKYVNSKGTSVVKLRRALYGCVESARIWNDKLHSELSLLGFIRNPYDKCIYNRIENDGTQSTLVVHVDDVLIAAKDDERVDKIMDEIETRFGDVTKHKGKIINYIGMTFNFSQEKKAIITMQGYIEDLMKYVAGRSEFEGTANDPARSNLFNTKDGISKLLSEKEKKFFHTLVAKLLYLGKRVRPDILVAVSFLCKRVQKPNECDLEKLKRVVQYIRSTREMGIVLEASNCISVNASVDCSFAVHDDMKSHTGYTVGIGKGPVCSKSNTQRLNTKSSTEAELVGLSDSMGHVIWLRNFLTGQGYKDIGSAIIGQDNKSTLQLVENGQPNSDATRHIAIRFFFIHDRVRGGEIRLEWVPTDDMIADILTKPLQGTKFKELRNQLLNWPSA